MQLKSIYKFLVVISIFICNTPAQDTLIFKQNYIPYPDTTLIFSPTSTGEEMPLMILLHGWSGTYAQWNSIIDLNSAAEEYGFLIVCPDGFYDSYYVDSPVNPNVQFEKFFWSDLIPKLLEDFNVDRENIFISGLSMGGHGAISLFLKQPDFFKAAGSTSGVLNLSDFPNRPSIKVSHGDFNKYYVSWRKNSSYYLLDNFTEKSKWMIIDCGTDDFFYKCNIEFYEKCKKLNLNVKFISQAGNHSRGYWSNSIWNHFNFFKTLIEENIPN